MTATYDCVACGACCFGPPTAYIDVRATDLVRMTDATQRRFVLGERARSMRMARGHCAALRVGRGPGGSAQHLCQIYPERPEACRSIEPGNRECRAARRRLARE